MTEDWNKFFKRSCSGVACVAIMPILTQSDLFISESSYSKVPTIILDMQEVLLVFDNWYPTNTFSLKCHDNMFYSFNLLVYGLKPPATCQITLTGSSIFVNRYGVYVSHTITDAYFQLVVTKGLFSLSRLRQHRIRLLSKFEIKIINTTGISSEWLHWFVPITLYTATFASYFSSLSISMYRSTRCY